MKFFIDGFNKELYRSTLSGLLPHCRVTVWLESNCRTIITFDCCNSGTLFDLPWRFEYTNNRFVKYRENSKNLSNKNIETINNTNFEIKDIVNEFSINPFLKDQFQFC